MSNDCYECRQNLKLAKNRVKYYGMSDEERHQFWLAYKKLLENKLEMPENQNPIGVGDEIVKF